MQPNPVDALIPWFVFGIVIALLLRVQKAVQYRIFGLGWMFSARHEAAAVIYTLVLLPGIVVHEFVEWITAGVMNFKTVRSMRWPEADKNGELDPKFITVEYPKLPKNSNTAQRLKDLFGKAIVEIMPTIVGILLTLLISNSILQLPILIKEIPTWDVLKIGDALGKVTSQPGFPLWFYILFTVSNSMMPRQFARRGMAILLGVAIAFMILLAIIGFSGAVSNWMNGPIPSAINQLSAIFGLVLVVDSVVFVGLVLAEFVIERVTQRKAPYKTAAERALAMRSAVPKPAPKPITSIYEYLVPLPSIPDVMGIRVKAPARELPRPEEKPAIPAPAAKPELPKPAEKPALPATPAFGTGRGIPAATPSKPAAEPAKIEEPAKPAFGTAPRPATSPFGAPKSTPAAATTSKPAEPARIEEPAKPAFGTAPRPATSPFGAPKSTPAAATTSKPAEPAKTEEPAKPAFGTAPRPGVPPPGGRPALPAGSTTANPPVPVARPGMPAPPVPGTKAPAPFNAPRPNASNPARRDDDIIDAEVIDEDDDEPTFMKGVGKPAAPTPSKPSFGGVRPNSPFSPPSKPFSAPQPKRVEPDDEDDENVHYDDVDDPA